MTENENKIEKCSICRGDIDQHRGPDGKVYWTTGNNADPVIIEDSNGRCCDWCDEHIVIPVRLKMMGLPPDVFLRAGISQFPKRDGLTPVGGK
tara:strand:+ start:920 stop:1198 length:279 start_codon:yes stop_codon:yes gene_type:complete